MVLPHGFRIGNHGMRNAAPTQLGNWGDRAVSEPPKTEVFSRLTGGVAQLSEINLYISRILYARSSDADKSIS